MTYQIYMSKGSFGCCMQSCPVGQVERTSTMFAPRKAMLPIKPGSFSEASDVSVESQVYIKGSLVSTSSVPGTVLRVFMSVFSF